MFKNFILDVDGVLTTGHMIYSQDGKKYKIFGPHDNDGLKMIKDLINIQFISADSNGFSITQKRILDMGFSVDLVSESDRKSYINDFVLGETIFMGDGFHDAKIMDIVGYSIAPKNARSEVIEKANFVTESKSGEGAVLDACLHIKNKFFDER